MAERTVLESISPHRIVSASPATSVYQAACVMAKAHCGSILIVDQAGTMHGIFTERDIMVRVVANALAPDKTPLSDVMTPDPRTIPPDATAREAVFLMKQHRIRHLPVVSATGEIMGVFSIQDATPGEIVDADDLSDDIDRQFTDILA